MLLQSQYDSKYHALIDTMGKREKELDNALKLTSRENFFLAKTTQNIMVFHNLKFVS